MPIALVTTAGLLLRSVPPYDIEDAEGDPTFRQIPYSSPVNNLMITHNYYDRSDADQDINMVFPVNRLREPAVEGMIGEVASKHLSFMGHILGRHIETLIKQTAPRVAKLLKADEIDAAFLTPA